MFAALNAGRSFLLRQGAGASLACLAWAGDRWCEPACCVVGNAAPDQPKITSFFAKAPAAGAKETPAPRPRKPSVLDGLLEDFVALDASDVPVAPILDHDGNAFQYEATDAVLDVSPIATADAAALHPTAYRFSGLGPNDVTSSIAANRGEQVVEDCAAVFGISTSKAAVPLAVAALEGEFTHMGDEQISANASYAATEGHANRAAENPKAYKAAQSHTATEGHKTRAAANPVAYSAAQSNAADASNASQMADGTHVFLDSVLQSDAADASNASQMADGTHVFLDSDWQSRSTSKQHKTLAARDPIAYSASQAARATKNDNPTAAQLLQNEYSRRHRAKKKAEKEAAAKELKKLKKVEDW